MLGNCDCNVFAFGGPIASLEFIDILVVFSRHGNEDVQESQLAEFVIDLLGQYAVQNLSSLVLKSAAFRQFKTNRIHAHLKTNMNRVCTLIPLFNFNTMHR